VRTSQALLRETVQASASTGAESVKALLQAKIAREKDWKPLLTAMKYVRGWAVDGTPRYGDTASLSSLPPRSAPAAIGWARCTATTGICASTAATGRSGTRPATPAALAPSWTRWP
jgi:hypothetical protein